MSFAVNFISTDGFEAVELADLSTGTKVVVIPSCGAILHEMGVQHRGAYINIIDHYDNAADFEKNVTSKGFKSCKLSPFACRVKNARYRFDEKDYVIEKFLLGDNALHGLIYDAPFTVQYQYADEKSAGVALQFAYRGTDPGYPFHYDCNIIYQLKHNNTLVISTTIINQDEGLIPVQDGWHPYFKLGAPVDELLLEFQSKDQWVFDSKMIPT
ncbi:MAG: aldose 1-epimerase, partial [Ferruginibacter sp.]